ncbi:MAG: hypothetical protein ACLQU3_24610 [Limisphaerales bacterium]
MIAPLIIMVTANAQSRAQLGTTTKAGSHANRNAGFIRQAGEWHWGCRINPAFRWWCQDAPHNPQSVGR